MSKGSRFLIRYTPELYIHLVFMYPFNVSLIHQAFFLYKEPGTCWNQTMDVLRESPLSLWVRCKRPLQGSGWENGGSAGHPAE